MLEWLEGNEELCVRIRKRENGQEKKHTYKRALRKVREEVRESWKILEWLDWNEDLWVIG